MKIFFLIFLLLFNFLFSEEETQITSLVFVSKNIENPQKTDSEIENIDVFIPNEESFYKLMTRFIGQEITLENLNCIKYTIKDFYVQNGYPFVIVNLLEQDATYGAIKFQIVISTIAKVSLNEIKYFSQESLEKDLESLKGKYVSTNKIINEIYWINTNPFRRAGAIFKDGNEKFTTDVDFNINEMIPFRVFAEYQNTSNLIAGESRYTVGFNWGNAFFLDHQLNFQFITAQTTKQWWAISANYIIPLPWKNLLKLIGFYNETKPSSKEIFGYTLNGKSWQTSFRYEVPIARRSFVHTPCIGYDFRRTDNILTYTGIPTPLVLCDISHLVLGYNFKETDRVGYSFFKIDFYLSPGRTTPYNKNGHFRILRGGSSRNYIYVRAIFDRITKLFYDFSWDLNFRVQGSTNKLLPSEEMVFGGYDSIRGYKENEIIADDGFVLKNEIRTSSFPLFFRKQSIKDAVQFLLFLDAGLAYSIDQNVYNKKHANLQSTGFGLRYEYKENFNIRLDYGWQLKNIIRVLEEDNFRSRIYLNASIAF